MRTVALRFAENFAPDCGTIAAHQEVIDEKGFVWYGKLGSPVSAKVAGEILMEEDPRILFIHSGGAERWWAHIEAIKRETPEPEDVPSYYRNCVDGFSCWFKIVCFERADSKVMSSCFVSSSGKVLTEVSRHSMIPYFIIDYKPSDMTVS